MPFDGRWQVVRPARLAVLDARFLAVASSSPKLMLAIVGRLVRRARAWLLAHEPPPALGRGRMSAG